MRSHVRPSKNRLSTRHRTGLLIALTALLTAACGTREAAVPQPTTKLPSSLVTSLDGAPTDLTAAIDGKPALVTFWATRCDACVNDLPSLERLSTHLANQKRGAVVGVAVGEPREIVAEFAEAHGVSYPSLVDERFTLADALGGRKIPTTLVVDGSGHIVYRGDRLDQRALVAFGRVLGTEEDFSKAVTSGSNPLPAHARD